jgi:hypothetical protein
MDKRELAKLLRRTNTADLLDDGIENGSDLKSFAKTEDDAVGVVDDVPKARRGETPTQSSPLRDLHTKEAPKEVPPREPVSYLGLFIGACLLVFGVVMYLYPRDVSVYHDRMRYRPIVEHVTTTGSQVYAVIAMIIGIALCWFSLYRPRK